MARKPMTIADTLRPQFEGIGGVDVEMPEGDAEFDVEMGGPEMVDGVEITELDDGGVEIDFEPAEDAEEEITHESNLALHMDDCFG